jgi:spermidine/putrescine transport system substrate-binding protein
MSKKINSHLSRRTILKSLAALGVSYSVMPLLSNAAKAANEVHYHTWSGYDSKELLKSYIDKYGGMPEVSHIASEEESFTKMKTGWAPDLIHPGNYNVRKFLDAGLIKPIDTSRLKNWNDIIEGVRTDDSCFMDGAQYMIPTEYGNSSIIYRKDLVDKSFAENPSWAILYDEKYKGRLANYETAAAVVQCAALVLGYSNIYDLNDEQLAEVKKLASKQRDMLRMYWSDATQLEQAIASGEVVAAYGWNASLVNLKKQGIDVEMAVPKERMFTWIAGFTMHKKVKNEDAAYDLIDAWSSAESGAWLMENYGYGSTNLKAYEKADPKKLEDLGISDPVAVLNNSLFFKSLDPVIEKKYQTLFADVQAGG